MNRINAHTHVDSGTSLLGRLLFALLLALVLVAPARAQLNIEITGGGGNQIPIAIVPFQG